MTSGKQAEENVDERRWYLHAFFDNSLDAILVTNDEGHYIDANPAACALLGYSYEELMQLNFLDLTPVPFRKEGLAAWQRFLAKGSESGEYSTLHKDGRVLQLEFRAVANILPGVHVSSSRDITGRKQTEEARKREEQARKESQLQYETLVQSLDGIVWEVDPRTFMFTFVSKQAERILGYPLERWFEGPDFWPDHMHPNDREWAVSFCVEATAKREDHQFEYRMIAADGSVVWLSDIVTVHVVDGQAVLLRGVMVDITERKRIEEKFRESESQLAEAQKLASVGSWNWEIQNQKNTWSEELYRILGLNPKETQTSYETFIQLVHPDDRDAVKATFRQTLQTKQPIDCYVRIIRPDGAERIIHSRGNTITDIDGIPIRMHGTVQDVTEHKQAEDALGEAERKYRSIFENAVEGIFQTTADGRFISANPALARMLGFNSPEELKRLRTNIAHDHYVNPQSREEFKQLMEEKGFVFNFELEAYRKDRSRIWISENVRAVRDEHGSILYYEGTGEDITDRKRTQEALTLFRNLIDQSSDAIEVLEPNTLRFLDCNATAHQTLGYTREDFLALTAFDIDPVIDEVMLTRLAKDSETSGFVIFESVHRRKDGSTFPVEINTKNIRLERDYRLSVVRDITDRKRAEAALRDAERKYRDIFENAGEGIFQSTPDGKVLAANPALAHMRGYSSPEELIHSCQDISRQIYVDPTRREEFKRHLEEQGAVRGFEHQVFRKDGSKIWISMNAHAVRDAQGGIQYYEGTVQDITDRKRAEDALRLFRALIDRSSDAIEVIDQDTLSFLDCNENAYRTLGYNREEFLSLSVFDIDPVVDRSTMARLDEEMGKLGFATLESIHRRKDGSTFPVEITVKVVRLERNYRLAVVRDITERKRAENALQESEERFRQLSEATFEAIILHDQETILEVNQSFCRQYGYERAEVIGKSVLDLALPEFRELLLQRVRSGDTDSYEGPALRKDGTTFRAEVAGKPIHYQGRVVRVAAIRDITERKRNERRQAAQYAVTRVLAEAATLAEATPQLLQVICESLRWKIGEFWRVCDSTNLLCCVATWHVPALDATSFIEASRQTELAPGVGLPGRVWQSGQPAWIPDVMTDPRFARAASAAKVGLRGAAAFPILLGNHTLGVMLFFSRRAPEVDEDLLKIMSAIGSQIGQFTERKRAEEALLASERKYRDIFTFAPVGIYQSLHDGRIITANHTLAEMLGYASVDELLRVKLGRDVYLVEDERERLIREHEVRGYQVDLELQWKTKDGSPIWVQLTAHAIKGANGATEYWEGFVRDITDRKRVEESLRESEERYRDLVENSLEFICTHDLNGLILSANRAASEVLGYDLKEFCGKKNFRDLLVPEVRDQFDDYLARIRRDGVASGLTLVQTSSGERRILEYHNTVRTEGVATPIVRGMARDITEQRRAEKAMSDLRHELELTMNSMEEGVHRVDLKGNIVFENPAAARMLGWGIDQLLGKPAHLTMHHTRQDGTPYPKEECSIYSTFRDGVSRQVADEVFWRQDGTSFPVEYMTAPMRNDRNEIVAAVVTFRDVTKRKRVEQALKQSEQDFRNLFEQAHDAIVVFNPEHEIVLDVNERACELYGFTRSEFIGMSLEAISKDVVRGKNEIGKTQERGVYLNFETVQYRKDGTEMFLEINASTILYQGQLVVLSINRDITERKRADAKLQNSEKYFRSLIENASDVITISDGNGIIRYESPSLERMLGYKPEERIGKSVLDLLHPDDLPFAKRHFAKGIRNPGIVHVMECRFKHKDGSWHLVETTGINLLDDPVVAGIVVNSRDITERKRAEEALRSYPRRLIEAQEAERQHIARELHDQIGQVLTAVRINLHTIGNSCETAESRPLIDQGVALIDAALEQVRDLSFELRPSLLDNLGLVAALRWYSDQYAKRTGIRTKSVTNLPEGQTRLSHELETACFRIVQEALTNVVRHAKASNVLIHLKQIDHQIVLSIKDDGIGFIGKTNGAAAASLGVRGMKERALALGGLLEIKSGPAQGTEIRVTFPTASKED